MGAVENLASTTERTPGIPQEYYYTFDKEIGKPERAPGIPQEYYYTFDKATGTIIKYNDTIYPKQQCITIPAKINGVDVKCLGAYAFSSVTATSIYISDGIEEICNLCFDNCMQLTELWLPKTLKKLGNRIFEWCTKLVTIGKPERAPGIPRRMRNHSEKLETLVFGPGVEELLGALVISCPHLTDLWIASTIKSRWADTFYDNSNEGERSGILHIHMTYNPDLLARAPFGAGEDTKVYLEKADCLPSH